MLEQVQYTGLLLNGKITSSSAGLGCKILNTKHRSSGVSDHCNAKEPCSDRMGEDVGHVTVLVTIALKYLKV